MKNKEQEFFSDYFTRFIIDCTGGYIPSGQMDSFFKILQQELERYCFSKLSEANLIRLLSSLFDKISFIKDSLIYPKQLEIIAAIVCTSNFLTDIIVQNPEFLFELFDSEYRTARVTSENFKSEISAGLGKYKTLSSKLNYLKRVKRQSILKIGICDILKESDLTETTKQLSALASVILSSLFELCYEEVALKYNIILPAHKYCLASLGKHGGNELNYSSDVDLICFYEMDYIPEEALNKNYYELLNETIQLFIKHATEMTWQGYLYRIDFRLRPDGRHAPLCGTINEYMLYYESRGENWERQMLIKLNYVCGGKELFNNFYKYLQGFIFQSNSGTVKMQVVKIKKDIERKSGAAGNVKLFSGGIRDIEFSVQVLQLLNGRKNHQLRNGNTLESIGLLLQHGLLKNNEAAEFKEAYIFYRNIEHFLQLMNDTQTHIIPGEGDLLDKLCSFLRLKSNEEFDKVITQHRNAVGGLFKKILSSGKDEIHSGIHDIPFKDKKRADSNLSYLQNGSGLLEQKLFDSGTIDKFKPIEKGLISFLKRSQQPDKILDNFAKVIRASQFPSIWYDQFKSRKFLADFLNICLSSQKAIDIITSNKLSEDYYLSGSCFALPANDDIASIDPDNLLLNLSVLYALGKLNAGKLSGALSCFVDSKIKQFSRGFTLNYFIAALGSYGSCEMNFSSDIDFIFVAGDAEDILNAERCYEELIAKLNSDIKVFEIDLRLRPEGNNSQLVRNLESYKKYFSGRARTWEFQTLCKMRFVCGNEILFNSFKRFASNQITRFDKSILRTEIIEMLKTFTKPSPLHNAEIIDFKKSKGGFATIDFIIQYLLLTDSRLFLQCMGKPTGMILKKLSRKRELTGEMNTLSFNYNFLKKTMLTLQNSNNSRGYKFNIGEDSLNEGMELGTTIKAILKENFNIFEKLLEN